MWGRAVIIIPLFPSFCDLDLSIKDEYEAISLRYDCYTEFNFQDLFIWNIRNTTKVSLLNGNLVVLRNDYLNQDQTISFLGTNNFVETCAVLLDYMSSNPGIKGLHHLPESCVSSQVSKDHIFTFKEEVGYRDYVINASQHSQLVGKAYASIREKLNRFDKYYGGSVVVKKLDLSSITHQESIARLFKKWEISSRKLHNATENEELALRRALQFHDKLGLHAVGVFIDGNLASCAIQAVLSSSYEIGLFLKSDYTYRQVHDFTVHQTSLVCHREGRQFINIEHDLGIEGIRSAKLSLKPSHFFQKYAVSVV